MGGWDFLGKILQVSRFGAVGRKGLFRVIKFDPAFTPAGRCSDGEPAECRAHCKLVVSHHGSRSGMSLHEIENHIDSRFRIRPAINKIANKDNPTPIEHGSLTKSI